MSNPLTRPARLTELEQQIQQVYRYHESSKHRPGHYADGPDSLDWDLQPDPFRQYRGCKRIPLTLAARDLTASFADIMTPGSMTPRPLTLESIGLLLELSMGLSAWKQYGGDRWSLRCNPSSGNLHPTETYLVCDHMTGLETGVYHYNSYHHGLEQRARIEDSLQLLLPADSMLIGFSSIHWRESWKYGVRAYRYCHLDLGHAIACIRYAAALLGWQVQMLQQYSDQQVTRLLGLDRDEDFGQAERETADLLLLVSTGDIAPVDIEALYAAATNAQWSGNANILSPDGTIKWPAIDTVSEACKKPVTAKRKDPVHAAMPETLHYHNRNASELIRRRRSAQAFDANTAMSSDDFFTILASLLAYDQTPPFDCLSGSSLVHAVFYIHRVGDITPGLYALPRSDDGLTLMQQQFREQFEWQKPPTCPEHIPLYRLVAANCRNAARTLSCHQDIAADSAFAVSLLAQFDTALTEGPWHYRRLFQEAGMLGQVLYLQAEAAGFRGTGIGCFFDDAIHETLGIDNTVLQCLYNFTVGMPLTDARLVSLPPYSHLQQADTGIEHD